MDDANARREDPPSPEPGPSDRESSHSSATLSPSAVATDEPASEAESAFRDELNLAEFPITILSDRAPDGQTTLVFEDHLDQRDGPPIVRRLTITAPSKHGLPTALDDEVMVGLIQLTKRRNAFTDAKVGFSRYELIELLGWPHDGRSYRRIEEALYRWVSVVLMYENAWWDNDAKSWVDETFHILDNVTLYDRERHKRSGGGGGKASGRRASKSSGRSGEPLPLSSFRWNEVIFRSFQSGNLKQLDLEFYLQLRLPTTKRLFRFLDKRFYRRDRLDFDLRTLACEHVGMSRSYAPTELKRRLKPALEELERHGFLAPVSDAERYVKTGRGSWRILLIRGPRGRPEDADAAHDPTQEPSATEPEPESAPAPEAAADLAAALTARGVAARTAAELVRDHPADHLRAKLAVFDWLVQNRDKRVAKNPAGYLVASIRADYQTPANYPNAESPRTKTTTTTTTKTKTAPTKSEPTPRTRARRRPPPAADAEPEDRDAALRAQWDALPPAQRDAILAAVKAQHPGLRRWTKMLEALCLDALQRHLDATTTETESPSSGNARSDQPSLFP